MKRITALLLTALLIMPLFSACRDKQDSGEKISIVTTIFPQYDFARAIGGDKVKLKMLLPPGGEAHFYDATVSDIAAVNSCDMFIYVGGENDSWAEKILEQTDTSKKSIITLLGVVDAMEESSDGIIETEEHDHGHDDADETHADEHTDEHVDETTAPDEHTDEHADETHTDEHEHDDEEIEYDEHVWTSPVNAIAIVKAIASELCKIDSANANYYNANAEAYITKLQNLDRGFRDAVANGARKTVVFADRFPFAYFTKEYSLTHYSALAGCSTENAPSTATVYQLVTVVRDQKIPCVFFIEFSPETTADTICSETGCKKLLFHSCHNVSKEDFDAGVTYVELMTKNLENLKTALA